jgi:protein gp37
MGKVTGISWTDHTFSPWWGCTKISPGCAHCYAEKWDARWKGEHWGKDAPRRFFGPAHWREPSGWNADAARAHRRAKVFCGSMCDVFEDREDLDVVRRVNLWPLIRATPNLDWQLLTKRPENILRLLPEEWREKLPENIWIGTTVEDQQRAGERIPELLKVPAVVRFLSVEPLLEPVTLDDWLSWVEIDGFGTDGEPSLVNRIGWVIVGGESDQPKAPARPCDVEWIGDVVEQCHAARVPVFVKQLGSLPVMDEAAWRARTAAGAGTLLLNHLKHKLAPEGTVPLKFTGAGADPTEWPAHLRVQEFPEVRHAR